MKRTPRSRWLSDVPDAGGYYFRSQRLLDGHRGYFRADVLKRVCLSHKEGHSDQIRIDFVILIATPVVIVELVMKAFLPAMYQLLGIFVPLIVVNCIVIARAEAFAYKNPVIPSALDGLGVGTGFMLDLMLIGAIREFLVPAALCSDRRSFRLSSLSLCRLC